MSNDYDWRTNLFVYGTLKKGGRLHSVLGNSSEYIGTYITANDKYDLFSYARSFPILVAREKGFRIRGEVWSVTPETMDRVNAIESGSYEVGSVLVFMFPGNNHRLMPVNELDAVNNIKEWSV